VRDEDHCARAQHWWTRRGQYRWPEFSAIHDGKADAAIIGLESDSPLIQSSLRDSGIRLLSVTRAEALTRFFPSLVRLLLPAR
jgi:hypothetical protein